MAIQCAKDSPSAFAKSRLAKIAGHDPNELTNKQLVAAFRDADPWTLELIASVARPLGRSLVGIHLSLGVERFVIYGGFALALGDRYRQLLVEAARDASWQVGQDWDGMIELGYNDDYSGLIGAGRAGTQFHKRLGHQTAPPENGVRSADRDASAVRGSHGHTANARAPLASFP
jgi:glucokinase